MNSFWCNLYDRFKDRGNVAFFLGGMGIAFLFLLANRILPAIGLEYVCFGVGLFVAVQIGLAVRRYRLDRANRWTRQPLSFDEINKARSKLLRIRK